jgi:hypothetical protein
MLIAEFATEIEFRGSTGGADLTGSGTAISSSEYSGSYLDDYAFDDNSGTQWIANTNRLSYIGYDFGSGNDVDVVEISYTNGSIGEYTRLNQFDLQYSDDGTTWVTKAHFRDITAFTGLSQTKVYNVADASTSFDAVLRTLASNTFLPYVVTRSSIYDVYDGYAAFDESVYLPSLWIATATTGWLKIDLGAGNEVEVTTYGLRCNYSGFDSAHPKDFKLYGSNDDSSYDELDSRTNETGWSNPETRTYAVATPGTYRYYKLDVSANNGHGIYLFLGELYLGAEVDTSAVYDESLTLAIAADLTRTGILSAINALILAVSSGQEQSGGMTFEEAVELAVNAAKAQGAAASMESGVSFGMVSDLSPSGHSDINAGASFGVGAGLTLSAALSMVEAYAFGIAVAKAISGGADFNEAVILTINAIEARSATVSMDASLSLGIVAEQGDGTVLSTDAAIALSLAVAMLQTGNVDIGPQTYDEAVALATAMGMSLASIGTLREAVTLATAAGMGQAGQSVLVNALVLQATAAMAQTSVGALLASLHLDVSMGEALGTAMILQASVLLDVAGGLSSTGGMSLDDAVSLGVDAGMAQTVGLLLSNAMSLNVRAGQAQTTTLTAEAQIALSVACGQIDSMGNDLDVSVALSIVAGMNRWGIVPRIAAAKHLYNALARKREYDALARKREYDATPRKREYDDQ